MYTRRWCLILKRTQAFVSKRPVWPQASYLTSLSLLSVIRKFGINNSYSAGLFWRTKWESVASAQSGTWHFQSSLATFSLCHSLLPHCRASATTSVLMASYSHHTEPALSLLTDNHEMADFSPTCRDLIAFHASLEKGSSFRTILTSLFLLKKILMTPLRLRYKT